MMWCCIYLTVLLVGLVGASHINNSSNSCASVKTMHLSLNTVVEWSPYYLLETTSSKDLCSDVTSIEAVCFGLSRSCDCRSGADVHAVTLLKNGSTVMTTGIMTELKSGHFHVNAITFEYEDYFLGEPCPGTFVIYLCTLTGRCSKEDAVIIVSSHRSVAKGCLLKGESLARQIFPGLEFTTLPKSRRDPCSYKCDTSG